MEMIGCLIDIATLTAGFIKSCLAPRASAEGERREAGAGARQRPLSPSPTRKGRLLLGLGEKKTGATRQNSAARLSWHFICININCLCEKSEAARSARRIWARVRAIDGAPSLVTEGARAPVLY
jgi:hypothetical protein